ncbi:PIN domain-containing protein [Persephonella sp. KM09-Lau-8]|uniref:type II toxin-antitoxin system VapC family toxin n=1 Tax=Persephonella sp. KM09-Lau-8 TaxID=1158345 RepID=UPI0004980A39|nr:PIN domain-containing protein [Persephonella sp. KM09-Lau-8]
MNINKVFVDANVIIDTFDKTRKENESATKAIRYLLQNRNIELFTSCDLITTVYYVLKKKYGKGALYDIKILLNVYSIISFSEYEVRESIYLMENDKNFKDLEDTIQYVIAKNEGCDLILTNDKDFYSPDIKVLTTEEFIKQFNIKQG